MFKCKVVAPRRHCWDLCKFL